MTNNSTQNSKKTIIGKVDRILYHDPRSGRAILSLVQDNGKSCHVVGQIQNAETGTNLQVVGAWSKDEKYGWQFIAEEIQTVSSEAGKQVSADDGMMHAQDFSNVLGNNYKAFRNANTISDYSCSEPLECGNVHTDGALYNGDKTILVRVPIDSASFSIPDTVKCIGVAAFKDCKMLESVVFSSSVTTIRAKAFAGCEMLDLTVPASVNSIGLRAFYGCKSFRIEGNLPISWDDVRFKENAIAATITIGPSFMTFHIDFEGASVKMNEVKHLLYKRMPQLEIRMRNSTSAELVDPNLLRAIIFIDKTCEVELKDVNFLDCAISLPSPEGNTVLIKDENVSSAMNGIRDYLAMRIGKLCVHFTSIVDAEVLNNEELHDISLVMKMRDDLHSLVGQPKAFDRLNKTNHKHDRLLMPPELSSYLNFLYTNHAMEYPLIPIEEGEPTSEAKERGALFTLIMDGQPCIVWENFKISRATYVFQCTEGDYEARRQFIFDYIMTGKTGKRSFLRTEDCVATFGQKPRMVVHNNFESWTQRLMDAAGKLPMGDECEMTE